MKLNLMKQLLLIILTLILFASNVHALDCPIGLVNDTAPGSCGLYIDKNVDSLCDLSQDLNDSCDVNLTATDLTSTEIKAMTVEQVAEHYNIEGEQFAKEISKVAGVTVKKSDSFQYLHDNYAVRPIVVREVALAIRKNSNETITIVDTSTEQRHYLIPIILVTIIAYLSTWFLSKKEKISTILHRKIWNWLLLITFIPVTITSILWILRVEYGIIIPVFFNISYWHLIFGVIMILISVFHIIWHVKYYFKKR